MVPVANDFAAIARRLKDIATTIVQTICPGFSEKPQSSVSAAAHTANVS